MTKTTETKKPATPTPTPAPAPEPPPAPDPDPALRHQTLALALLAAQRDITHVVNDAENTHQRFKYASADGIIAASRRVLLAHGLVARVRAVDHESMTNDTGVKRSGEAYDNTRALVRVTFELSHAGSSQVEADTHTLVAISEVGRPLDKAILGARTSLWGYYLRDLLLLPRFDENEVSAHDDGNYDPNAIGKDSAAALSAQAARLGISVGFVREQAIKAGVPRDQVQGNVSTWRRHLLPRIQALLDHHAARQAEQHDRIKALPQKPDGELTYERTGEPPASDDVPDFKPRPPQPAAPAGATGKPAARGAAGGRTAVTRDPAEKVVIGVDDIPY